MGQILKGLKRGCGEFSFFLFDVFCEEGTFITVVR
jgi:hypothetical protein